MLFLAVLLHEAAHIVVLCLFHTPPKHCTVSALGFSLKPDSSHPLTYLQSATVSLAGPLMNLLVFFLCVLLGCEKTAFAAGSLALGVFHLLPIAPLDGATALSSILSLWFSLRSVQKILVFVSLVFLFPLAMLGFLVLLRSRYNFSLLVLCLYFLFCLVLG